MAAPEIIAIGVREVRKLLSHDRSCREQTPEGIDLREKDLFGLADLSIGKWDNSLPVASQKVDTLEFGRYYLGYTNEILWDNLKEQNPWLGEIDMEGILIAGGSVLNLIPTKVPESRAFDYQKTIKQVDIDLFLCGYKTVQECEDRTSELVREISSYYHEWLGAFGKRGKIMLVRTKHAITLRFLDMLWPDVQIILRKYDTPSQVLHGFDIGSCQMGIWQKKFITTSLGKFSLKYSKNIFDLSRRSTSYEYRLFVKYEARGFGIIMPELDIEKLSYTKNRKELKSGLDFWKIGDGRVKYNFRYKPNSQSDYGSVHNFKTDENVAMYNLRKILKNPDNPKGLIYSSIYTNTDDLVKNLLNNSIALPELNVVNSFLIVKGPFFGTTFKTKSFQDYFLGCDEIFYYKMFSNFVKNRQWGEIFSLAMAIRIEAAKNIMDLLDSEKLRNLLLPVEWITENPGQQLTGSFHPVTTSPEEWYEDLYKKFELLDIKDDN
jgi:hypothetical protein